MAARDVMTQRARIERRTDSRDAFGNELPATWAAHIAALACYWFQPSLGRAEFEGERHYRAYGFQMLVPLETDVTERDRVNGIVDRRGHTVSADVFGIIAIVRKPDHVLLSLEVIR